MFTKQDYQEYFKEIDTAERGMLRFLTEALARVDDEQVGKALQEIMRDEAHHVLLA